MNWTGRCLLALTALQLAIGGATARGDEAERHFESNVAPLLARRCVECHSGESARGQLNLSQRDLALAGGRSGPAIKPGKAAESLLWKVVDSDRMPKNGASLSAEEKRVLREWIDAGAAWPANLMLAPPTRGVAGAHWSRRLTVSEYIATVQSAVGVDIARDARRLLPPDARADGFSNTAYNLNIELAHVDAYAKLAELIVARMKIDEFVGRFSSKQDLAEAHLRPTIAAMGRRLFRGPLDEREVSSFVAVAQAVAKEGGNYQEAMGYVLEAMLQSPRFIHLIERQSTAGAKGMPDGFVIANRLSYALWGAPPDDELLRGAEAGELTSRERIAAQGERMLRDPRAVDRSVEFIAEWMHLDRLASLQPSAKQFPQWNARLAEDMRQETMAYFRHLVWDEKRPLADLLNAQVTFATPRLARHYGLSKPSGGGSVAAQAGARSEVEPIVLYEFRERSGNMGRDSAGEGEPIDLVISDPSTVAWTDDGLTVNKVGQIASPRPPKRLFDAIKKSNALTIEAWLTPADLKQAGPARIVTLSSGSSARNFTLGQDGDKFDFRFRAKSTDGNGMPSLASPSKSVKTERQHVVVTRAPNGKGLMYVNGEKRGEREFRGDLANWDAKFVLSLANETSGDRGWRGTLHRVALYDKDLSQEQVKAAYESGGEAGGLARYDLTAVDARGGLLTHGSVLTIGGDEASMVTRGLFVMRELLFATVEDPPPCVDTSPVPTKPGLSQRAVALTRIANQSCTGCHSKFEPLAFGLERFDGVGAWHERDEHGNQLREDGEVHFPDRPEPATYRTSAELMDLLAGSDRVQKAITRKVVQFALGRPLAASDAPQIDAIHAAAYRNGGTYQSLASAIIVSDLFLTPVTSDSETGP